MPNPSLSYLKTIVILLATAVSANGFPMRFEVKDAMQRDLVSFQSDAPLEKIFAITSAVTGVVETDLKDATQTKTNFEIDLRTFVTTGAAQNDFLAKLFGTSDNPLARLTLDKFKLMTTTKNKSSVLADQTTLSFKTEGTFEFHNLKKAINGIALLTYWKESDLSRQRLPGNLLKFSFKADISGEDFLLAVPDGLKSRVAKTIQFTLDTVANDAAAPLLK
jgi:hypothetical protein